MFRSKRRLKEFIQGMVNFLMILTLAYIMYDSSVSILKNKESMEMRVAVMDQILTICKVVDKKLTTFDGPPIVQSTKVCTDQADMLFYDDIGGLKEMVYNFETKLTDPNNYFF